MEKMETPAEHLSLLHRAERYWVESRRPLASLVFILPLLVIYEVGVLWFGVRPNGADDFMRRLLDMLGFGQHFLLPGLIVGILLGWHYLSRSPWRLSAGVLSAMAVESIVLGLCVRVIPLRAEFAPGAWHCRESQGGRGDGREHTSARESTRSCCSG